MSVSVAGSEIVDSAKHRHNFSNDSDGIKNQEPRIPKPFQYSRGVCRCLKEMATSVGDNPWSEFSRESAGER